MRQQDKNRVKSIANKIQSLRHSNTFYFLLYALIVLSISWPAPQLLSQKLIGNNVDNWIFYWNNWWVKYALANGETLFETQKIFFPNGTSLVAHSHSILNSLIAIPIDLIAGPVVAYNSVILLGLWLSGVGMFLLVRQLTHSKEAAFIAGLVFALAPYHLTQALAHYHLSAIQWWPFFALLLHLLLEKQQWRYVMGTAVFAALTIWSGVQLGLLLALWTLFYLAWHYKKVLPIWRQVVGVTAVSLILCLPFIIPLLAEWNTVQAAQSFDESSIKQTDLLAYWVPPVNHPLWGEYGRSLYENFISNQAFMPYLGYAVVGLIFMALWRRWQASRFWLLITAVWLILASGSLLRINGVLFEQIPLPYAWISHQFPISLIRSPDRFNLLVVFSTAVLAGLGAAAISQTKKWLLWPISILILLEFWVYPFPMWELPLASPYLETVAGQSSGVLDYPMGYTNSKFWLYYQTIHQQPTVEGHVSRFSEQTYRHIFENELTRQLYSIAELPPRVPFDNKPTQPLEAIGPALRQLQAYQINSLIVHKPFVTKEELAYLAENLPLLPIYQDTAITVYDFASPRSTYFNQLPTPLTPNVTLIENSLQLDSTNQILRFYLLTQLTAPSDPLDCTLIIGDETAVISQSLLFEKGQESDLFQFWLTAVLPSTLAQGNHPIYLQCDQGELIPLPDQLINNGTEAPYLSRSLHTITYQNEINLVGYRWWTHGASLTLTIQWRAINEISADYKEFIHLLDKNGTIVRQYDAIPCQWACPTTGWQRDVLVHDSATLDLWGLPAGEYQIALGLYNAQTGERLSATSQNESIPEGYFIISEPISVFNE